MDRGDPVIELYWKEPGWFDISFTVPIVTVEPAEALRCTANIEIAVSRQRGQHE